MELTFLNKRFYDMKDLGKYPYFWVVDGGITFAKNPSGKNNYKIDWSTYNGKTVQAAPIQ